MSLVSFRRLRTFPAGTPLVAEDLLEFHASRILLLVHLCGDDESVNGLTKLAKLDFFVRYPEFFARACRYLGKPVPAGLTGIEASMVRHHYGPWDHRYYHVLAFLEGTGLLSVSKSGARAYRFSLTASGVDRANALSQSPAFESLVQHIGLVSKRLGNRNGDSLKKLIYDLFQEEVAQRPLGSVIG